MNSLKFRSKSQYALMGLLLLQGLSGLWGGLALVWDSAGGLLQMPLSLLEGSPFDTSYITPGLILLLILGIFPLVVCYGLWKRRAWSLSGSFLVSISLLVWIEVEIVMVGYHSEPPLQLIYGLTGIALLILSQMTSAKS
jgi:hypothetical protein